MTSRAMTSFPRLIKLAAAATCLLALCSCSAVVHRIGGASTRPPSEMPGRLSPGTQALVRQVYAGVRADRLADYHVHLAGTGEGGTGCYVSPRMLTWAHPWHHFRFQVYSSAAGIHDMARADSQFAARLTDLARTAPGKFLLLAFDEHWSPDGRVVAEKTEFHVPNDHALRVAASAPSHFAAAGSVHPLRPGACQELCRLHARGVRVIKWLPNAMGINPAAPACDAFYDTMHRLGMALLTHGGVEAAVDAAQDQCLGNPQHLQRPLEHGVKVIVAHCASLGDGEDHAAPGSPPVENWKLLLRMMDEPRWRGLLFADISATTLQNRTPEFMRTLLSRQDLHSRLVNGSDYPLPAVNIVIPLQHWVRAGLLDSADIPALRELYDVNPLVFDFALKRRLRYIQPDGRILRLSDSIFEEHPALPLSGPGNQQPE